MASHDEEDINALRAEAFELRALFELQQRRLKGATDRWRAEDPETRARIIPDLGVLVQWLMERADVIPARRDLPDDWRDLLDGLKLLSRGAAPDVGPLWCDHDVLAVCVDETAFTAGEVEHLEKLGFLRNADGGFKSYRFGNA
jgi:hypothetical protein